jgi:GNAT superfamily N-acetyltransferase
MFAVDPDVQGMGVGAALLQAAESQARDQMGATTAVLWVSIYNQPCFVDRLECC